MDGVEVTAAAIEGAATAIAPAEAELETFGSVLQTACTLAASAAGTGPLAGSLETFGEDVEKQAKLRGAECRELSQGVRKTLDDFTAGDQRGAEQLAAPSFGGVGG